MRGSPSAGANSGGGPNGNINGGPAGSVSVLRGDGTGTFQATNSFALLNDPTTVAIAELTGDARPDLIVTNYRTKVISVLVNETP